MTWESIPLRRNCMVWVTYNKITQSWSINLSSINTAPNLAVSSSFTDTTHLTVWFLWSFPQGGQTIDQDWITFDAKLTRPSGNLNHWGATLLLSCDQHCNMQLNLSSKCLFDCTPYRTSITYSVSTHLCIFTVTPCMLLQLLYNPTHAPLLHFKTHSL